MNALRGVATILRRIGSTLPGAAGLAIVLVVLIAAVFAPWVATANPDQLDVMNRFAGPSFAHWLGTDHLGRDLYSRLVHGTTVAMSVALALATLGFTLFGEALRDAVDPRMMREH